MNPPYKNKKTINHIIYAHALAKGWLASQNIPNRNKDKELIKAFQQW